MARLAMRQRTAATYVRRANVGSTKLNTGRTSIGIASSRKLRGPYRGIQRNHSQAPPPLRSF